MDVTLTNVEISLFDSIDFDPQASGLDEERAGENEEMAKILTYSLLSRAAVPRHRLIAFDNENGRAGEHAATAAAPSEGEAADAARIDALVAHDQFLRYLHYFICGPDLPEEFVKAFRRELRNAGGAAGDTHRLLGRIVEMVRPLPDPASCAGDFYRLALECNIEPAAAREIGNAVAAL